jgi:phosphoribosylanthranilate isomerase
VSPILGRGIGRTRIKFCGITRPADVASACALGVDAVGFVCYPPSARHVAPAQLVALAPWIAPFVTPVLLFVDAARDDILRALEAIPNALLQFHGHESPAACNAYGRPYLRAVAIADGVDLLDWQVRYETAAGLLVDAPAALPAATTVPAATKLPAAAYGGGGRRFDWTLLPAPALRTRPLILAGGLDPGNVAGAIRAAAPAAVDVSSGIESSRGVKSESLMRAFVAAVAAADRDAPGATT